MRPPRLIILLFCFIFLPILYTLFSALFVSPHVATPSALAGRTTGLRTLFSFNLPSSLFPPSAIISLTDDNSTFFLSRPAAFGPSLPNQGLSGQLWVGNGFGEGLEGELGCSDIPGWEGGDTLYNYDKPKGFQKEFGKSGSGAGSGTIATQDRRLPDSHRESHSRSIANNGVSSPSIKDGTDDHLHHPLRESDVVHISAFKDSGDYSPTRPGAHADVQSLQESAEIAGKVVLLSRGGCGFLEKVKWVQRRGGVAVIVGDDTTGGSLVTMYARGDTSNVTIPALFTSHTTAHLLSSLVPPQLAAQASRVEEAKSSRTKSSSSTTSSTQYVDFITTPSATPSPTPTPLLAANTPPNDLPRPEAGLFHGLLSLLGLGSSRHVWHASEDSRRPPTSGNIDWVLMDSWDQLESSIDGGSGQGKSRLASGSQRYSSKADDANADGDGFVIGVHDWRDPDLAPTRRNAFQVSSAAYGQETPKSQTKELASTPTGLKGGSVTPGSGEYMDVEKSSVSKPSNTKIAASQSTALAVNQQHDPPASEKGWFSRHLNGRASDEEMSSDPNLDKPDHSAREKKSEHSSSRNRQTANSEGHEGLWVTLTPTSMSTSPFFDTLLVLVISPLLTLSIVYVLLLIRSRVRRRRWRAPKSVVERLPVRTYHTIPTPSSDTSSSRSSSHCTESPAAPLLSGDSPQNLPSGTRSPMVPGSTPNQRIARSKAEKSRSGSRLWRRKYTGRQVECVVCLEEYIDGESRVMSLPCGHEFHAECM